MFLTEPYPAVANFWAPVAQIVPVFGLALVFEVRRYAVHWPDATRRVRRWQSAYAVIVALVLLNIELWALLSMQTGAENPVLLSITPYLLILSFAALSYFPIASFAGSVNADIPDFFEKTVPWSKWRRHLRKFDKKVGVLEADMQEMAAALDLEIEKNLSTIQESEQLALRAEALMKWATSSEPVGVDELPEGALETAILDVKGSLADNEAIVAKARARLAESYRLRDLGLEHFAHVADLRNDVNEMKSRKPSDADRERYERLIRRLAFLASEPTSPRPPDLTAPSPADD